MDPSTYVFTLSSSFRGDTEGKKAMSILLHGDAAFAGQAGVHSHQIFFTTFILFLSQRTKKFKFLSFPDPKLLISDPSVN